MSWKLQKTTNVPIRQSVGGAQWRRRGGRQDHIGHFKHLDLQPRDSGKPLRSRKLKHDKVWVYGE